MSPIKNVALINELGQVINNVVVDTDDTETIAALHKEWQTTRFVETADNDVIHLSVADDVWTTHCDDADCDKTGFNLPDFERFAESVGIVVPTITSPAPVENDFTEITINGRQYPDDSLLIKENAFQRPAYWVLPDGAEEVSIADKE